MIDIGVARPSAQGQAMISTATALTSAWASRGSGPQNAHTVKVATATAITIGTNHADTVIGKPLDGRTGTLRLADHADDLGQQGIGAHALRFHDERAGAVHGAAGHLGAGSFLDGNRLAGDHRFVDGGRPFEHDAVHGNPLSGTHTEAVAHAAHVRGGYRSRSRRRATRVPSSAPGRANS